MLHKTKIIATVGPACNTFEKLLLLLRAATPLSIVNDINERCQTLLSGPDPLSACHPLSPLDPFALWAA